MVSGSPDALMDKPAERETAPRASLPAATPALAVQFFLIPLVVVAVVASVYVGFRMLITDDRTPEEYLSDVRTGGRERRWPAAYELSRLLADPDVEARNPTLGQSLVQAFADTEGDDPRVRRYLALAVGNLRSAPPEAIEHLVAALDDPDSETRLSVIWALASLGDASVTPRVAEMYASDDAGIRKMAVYALGTLAGETWLDTVRTALHDPAPDVQWNAAVALARRGERESVPVLRRMLDREYVERTVTRTPSREADIDPVGEVIVTGLQAAAVLQERALREQVVELSRSDRSLRVRQAALEVLKGTR